ncbi:tol-pal system protein YbgF [Silvibacterium bohemicum]|uniref:Tol-pal system protein YbgF n=1 Tax=Silvibacterium bohemicum TaxID=1577686 RepID=A0A841JQL2_9BACT|nr:tetratricopeptide repeat protein [Silvibacterium bohemicum]MBB6143440.1 tol-pal system protein YbgF [Silvibacterium bohemicum]
MRKSLIPLSAVAALALLLPAPPAHAVSKEMIQLQTQVQQLQDALQHLQQSNDERMGVLQHLIEQTADSVNRMSQTLNTLQDQVQAQNGQGGKVDQISGQIQGVNDSIDELKTRVAKVDKSLQDLQSQLQNINAQPAGGAAPQTGQPGQPAPAGTMQPGQPQASLQPQAPPVDQLYQSALRDYTSARYDVATGEFGDVLKYYPQDDLAGNAYFYLGEISYRKGDYPTAIQNYDAVLEQFAGSPKAPAAQLRKGLAELAGNQRDAGVRDLRSLIQRYPQTPEAEQARSKLNGLGVKIVASKPSAYR